MLSRTGIKVRRRYEEGRELREEGEGDEEEEKEKRKDMKGWGWISRGGEG